MFIEFKVLTEFGPVDVTATDAKHVHVSAGSSGRGRLPYRGDEYYVSIHLGLYDGVWALYRDEHGQPSRTAVSLTRNFGQTAPPSYKKKIVDEILEKVSKYLDEYPETMVEAEQDHLKREFESALEDYNKAEKAYAEASQKYLDASKAYNEFRDNKGRK